MFKEFREFINRGSVLDLAIGIIIGASFTGIVNSLVKDIIMPPIGLLLGQVNFSSLYINLSDESFMSLAAAQEAGAATINYGMFINTVINFFIVAFVVFLVVKGFNRMKRKDEPAAATTKPCRFCLSVIPLEASRCPHCTSQLETGD